MHRFTLLVNRSAAVAALAFATLTSVGFAQYLILSILVTATASLASAQDDAGKVLFKNVHVFDGVSKTRIENANVLVEGKLITAFSTDAIDTGDATVIDGGGRTLMPGLTDTHVHIAWTTLPQGEFLTALPEYNAIHSTVDAKGMLMRGFTSVRDMGGSTFGLKQAIDRSLVPGPRIYPAGGPLSQTAGHGDFRFPNQTHPRFGGHVPPLYLTGAGYLVDGVPEVLAAARENLRHGASHIKLMAGGGYASPADPLLGNQFTYDEIKAAVDTAADWGTYVTIHSYHPEAINRAIDAGIKDVGHGQLVLHDLRHAKSQIASPPSVLRTIQRDENVLEHFLTLT